MADILKIVEIPENEKKIFVKTIRTNRPKLIRSSQEIVDTIFESNPIYETILAKGEASQFISKLREDVWQEFLLDEVEFNAHIMKNLHCSLEAPNTLLNALVKTPLMDLELDELQIKIKEICGEYAGRVFPYIYALALSNTNSRRSSSGKTFEAIIYKVYEILEYPFASQGKIGRKIFSDVGLGKKVDSVLPSISAFTKRRNRTIIGTMKTSLRERWQEVAEEIERTKIPEIHLLTADEDISGNKAKEMSKHNIVVVVYDYVKRKEHLKDSKNIVSFEEYFYDEIPGYLKFWKL